MVGKSINQTLTRPRAIIFDWHATLVDTFDAMYHAIDDVLHKFHRLGLLKRMVDPVNSKNIEDAKLVEYVRTYKKLHPKVAAEQKVSRTDIFEVLFDQDEDAKEIAHIEFNKCYRDHFGEIHPIEEGVYEMLEELRAMDIKLGVMTNRDREFLTREINIIQVTGWTHLFETVVCGDDVINRKPAPDPILKTVENLGMNPGLDCWYVGDSSTDTVSAKSAGVTSIFFNGAHWDQDWLEKIFPGTRKYPHKPDAVVNNCKEFMQLVNTCQC